MTPAVPTVNSAMPCVDHPGPDSGALLIAGAAAQRHTRRDAGGEGGGRGDHSGLAGRDADRWQTVAVDAAHREDPVAPVELLDVEHAVQGQRRRVGDPLLAPIRYRKYSWPLANQRVRSNSSGSLSRSQANFAADQSGDNCMPVRV